MKSAENSFMQQALEAAQRAAEAGEVPVGAVLVDAKGTVLAVASNRTESSNDPTGHAEMIVLREACARQGAPRLEECDLYVSLEPCAMCAAAISFARVRRLYFGAYDPKGGAVDHGPRFFAQSTCHHAPEVVGGIMESDCGKVLQDFFKARRA
jgi:tRNA(Arg) A34 adenosine deaminase TadA